MASSQKNLSSYKRSNPGMMQNRKFALIVSEWNEEITESLYNGAVEAFLDHGVIKDNILR